MSACIQRIIIITTGRTQAEPQTNSFRGALHMGVCGCTLANSLRMPVNTPQYHCECAIAICCAYLAIDPASHGAGFEMPGDLIKQDRRATCRTTQSLGTNPEDPEMRSFVPESRTERPEFRPADDR